MAMMATLGGACGTPRTAPKVSAPPLPTPGVTAPSSIRISPPPQVSTLAPTQQLPVTSTPTPTHAPKPAFRDDEVVGIWSSASRTKGGLGSQWVFTKDGSATYTFGALVDFKYDIKGNHTTMTLLGPDQSVTKEVWLEEFSIDGAILTVNPRTPAGKQVMKRAGETYPGAHPIVGDWTYTHYTGGLALMRYSREGIAQLSVPFQTITGTYHINQGILAIAWRDQESVNSKFRREKSALVLVEEDGRESRYLQFEY